jgi:hypothetical protein
LNLYRYSTQVCGAGNISGGIEIAGVNELNLLISNPLHLPSKKPNHPLDSNLLTMASSLPPSSQIYFIVMVGLLISFHQATASFQCNEVWSKKATSRQSQWRRGCSLNSLPIMEQYDDFLIRDCRYTGEYF